MNECAHCGKKSAKLTLVDEEMHDGGEDEKIYLCKTCQNQENKGLKKRTNLVQRLFGVPSANRTMRMVKSWAGEYEDITLDEDNTALPKWLLEKGLMNMYDVLWSRADIRANIRRAQANLKKPENMEIEDDFRRKSALRQIKEGKESLKQFKIEYFQAADVEKLARLIMAENGGKGVRKKGTPLHKQKRNVSKNIEQS